MRLRHWTMFLAGVLAIGTLALVPASTGGLCPGGHTGFVSESRARLIERDADREVQVHDRANRFRRLPLVCLARLRDVASWRPIEVMPSSPLRAEIRPDTPITHSYVIIIREEKTDWRNAVAMDSEQRGSSWRRRNGSG